MSHRDHRLAAPRTVTVGVLTVSDTRTPETDESGRLIRDLCSEEGHAVAATRLVPDDPGAVRAALADLLGDARVQAVLITGGTGISSRDRTLEAVTEMIETRLDGFGEIFRALSFREIGPAAMLSRAVAGLVGGRPVFSMPGSPGAVRLAMRSLILPEIGHIVSEAARRT